MNYYQITLGKIIWRSRIRARMSQKELAIALSGLHPIDFVELSKIENDRIDVRGSAYEWLSPALSQVFDLDIAWIETARIETKPELPDSKAISTFPVLISK